MMINHVFVALDDMTREETFAFLQVHGPSIKLVKIGLEQFCRYGREFVHEISDQFQKKIFLDLKLHDIPNTVSKAIAALSGLPISYLSIHLQGGPQMINAALQASRENFEELKLLGVSYLTSLSPEDFQKTWAFAPVEIISKFETIFKLAIETKIHGLVLSGEELPILNSIEGYSSSDLIKVCPGIRFQDEIDANEMGDQSRVLSPAKALAAGADFLVMGRSITKASSPQLRLDQLK